MKSIKNIPCKCFAPATIANVAVGYDILGFAIDGIGDDVVVRKGSSPGLKINSIRGSKVLSKDTDKNVAGFAGQKLLDHLGIPEEPVEIDLYKNMPIGTGMGSSAASAVAGVFAVNEYLGRPCETKELLHFATMGEQLADGSFHADNVAPSLMGGFILIRDNPSLDVIRLPSMVGLRAIVIYPHVQVLTKDSRDILSDQVDLSQHVKQSGNLAAFVAALYRSDLELMKRSLNDIIIEPQRAQLIPRFYDVKDIAIKAGALGFSISGAGPSMFALCANTVVAEDIVSSVSSYYKSHDIETTIYNSPINLRGAFKY